jgi:hypothetical protein
MARSEAALGALMLDPRWQAYSRPVPKEWTDDYSSLASLIHWNARQSAR